MFNSESSRFSFWAAISLAAVLLTVVGAWGFSGFFGTAILASAVLCNVGGTLYAPGVPRSWYGPAPIFFGVATTLVSLLVGCLMFGWWGIAYAGGSIVGFLLSSAGRR